jgi:ferrous iron transport protein A
MLLQSIGGIYMRFWGKRRFAMNSVTPSTSPSPSDGRIALSQLVQGQKGRIVQITGGRGFVSRLGTLGFIPGHVVEMEANYGTGPIIVNVEGVEIALGRGEADRIAVIPIAED